MKPLQLFTWNTVVHVVASWTTYKYLKISA